MNTKLRKKSIESIWPKNWEGKPQKDRKWDSSRDLGTDRYSGC